MAFQYTVKPLESVISTGKFTKDYVDEQRFLECCKECPNYGAKWSCPPFAFDVLEFWRSFGTLRLFGTKIILGAPAAGGDYSSPEISAMIRRVLQSEKRKLMGRLLMMENELSGSVALSAGSCDECAECTRKSCAPCRRPEVMRHSIESLGGDVGAVSKTLLGTEIRWVKNSRVPEYMVLVGGLLIK